MVSGSSAEVASSDSSTVGSDGQRAGDADALLLAAGELRRVGGRAVAEADQVEQLERAAAPLGAPDAGDLQRQLDVLGRGARGQQVEVLEDHADPAAGGAQLAGRASA